MDGSFTFSVKKANNGHTVYLDTRNTMQELCEMLVMQLIYLAQHDQRLADDIIEVYRENMQELSPVALQA